MHVAIIASGKIAATTTIDHGGLAATRQPGSAVFGVPLTPAQASGVS